MTESPKNRIFPQSTAILNDGWGFSNGMFGDGFKLAGGRYNPDPDSWGKPCSILGCNQNGPGSIAGWGYGKGGFRDMVLESFSGPHDMANSFWYYNSETGNIKSFSDWSTFQKNLLEYSTNYSTSLMIAAPFAAGAISEQSNYSAYQYLRR